MMPITGSPLEAQTSPARDTIGPVGAMRFRKLHGAGNDFILVTAPEGLEGARWSQLAQVWCARRIGIGADGLVLARPAAGNVVQVRCVNADGADARMCGNALRCVAWCVARDHGLTRSKLVMAGVVHDARVEDECVWVTANLGALQPHRLVVTIDDQRLGFDFADTGTEHVVAVVPDVTGVDVERTGRYVRWHPGLAPGGANVNFVQAAGPGHLRVRTFERGVEAETLSCGSGAVAAAVIAHRHGLVDLTGSERVVVHNQSGTPLLVRPHTGGHTTTFWVGGPVSCVFEGVLA
jgi:diaminopimelate epimerase